MSHKAKIAFGVVAGVFLLVLVGAYFWLKGDGIEDGKEYALGYTYLAKLDEDGNVVPGEVSDPRLADVRVLDFADRSLPQKSLMVPLTDGTLRFVVSVDSGDQTPGTAKRVLIKVPPVKMEGLVYHNGFEYRRWEIRFSQKEEQRHFPSMKPTS